MDGNTRHISAPPNLTGAVRTVTITLPQTFFPLSFALNLAEGTAGLCALSADRIELSVGSGSLSTKQLTDNEIELEVGARRLQTGMPSAWEFPSDAGMGSISVHTQ